MLWALSGDTGRGCVGRLNEVGSSLRLVFGSGKNSGCFVGGRGISGGPGVLRDVFVVGSLCLGTVVVSFSGVVCLRNALISSFNCARSCCLLAIWLVALGVTTTVPFLGGTIGGCGCSGLRGLLGFGGGPGASPLGGTGGLTGTWCRSLFAMSFLHSVHCCPSGVCLYGWRQEQYLSSTSLFWLLFM